MAKKKKSVKLKPMHQDDVFKSKHVLDAVLSPAGDVAVYHLCETVGSGEKERQLNSLWQVDVASGKTKRLTAQGSDAASPAFTPDGRSVLFMSARDPEGQGMQVHRLPLDGGEAEAITSLPQGVTAFTLSPDGNWIAFTALQAPPKPPGPNDHVRINRLVYRFDMVPGYIQNAEQAVYLVSVKGGKPRALTKHEGLVMVMAWSPDSSEIAFTVGAKASQSDFTAAELCVVNRKGKCETIAGISMTMFLFWTADGGKLGFVAAPGSDLSRQSQLWLVDRAGGKPRSRTAKLDLAVGGLIQVNSPAARAPAWSNLTADGKAVLVPVSSGGKTTVYRIALSGRESCEPVIKGRRTCKPVDRKGNKLLFTAQDLNTPSELFLADLETGEERALTQLNAKWQAAVRWPTIEHLTVTSAPGVEIEGWVLKPRHVRPPYKTVLYIHGGPHAGFGWSYNEDFQELVGAGYAVAFANPRGSTGYGDAFSKSIIGCWGKPEEVDFHAFLDELVKRGIAHPNRIGVTGVSGGGHLSAWLIGRSARFKAAVPEQGVYNMFSMYGVSDAGIPLISLEMGGPPHKRVKRYWELSPLAYAHKCKTPTLLIQGENDIRCPMEQAEQLFSVLKYNSCEVELLRLQGCNHGLEIAGPPPLRRFRMDAMIDWFKRYLK
ncbi:MAG: S9 family peptidase [Deltaproteobacteria bacterium]|nr:S9 family peptidase [Deltaproteobacteria bacterium]